MSRAITVWVPLFVMGFLPTIGLADGFPRHNFNFGAGAGVPRSQLGSFFDPKAGASIGYGYRFHEYFQADIGFDAIFGAGNVREFANTITGFRRIRDFQYLLPVGGRAILPLANGRLQLFGGGGGTYMRYQEQLSQPSSYYRLECPDCTARSGWGYYATAGFTVFLDRRRLMRIGVAPRVYRGHTDGERVGNVPGFRTSDHWVTVMAEFGISF
jgi:hypothetical protein